MGPRVLIVDDHEGFRTWAGAVLNADGYEVVGEAANGASALSAVQLLRPDLVLLDIQLPDIDGFELARLLADTRDGPAVILTSSRQAEDYGGLVEESFALAFIPKSELSGDALQSLLRERR
jgi:DNA-binding NarL/FixJ family response regulator